MKPGGFAIYSYRRVKDLSHEMTARRIAEIEARQLASEFQMRR
jgi:hypothetical protein